MSVLEFVLFCLSSAPLLFFGLLWTRTIVNASGSGFEPTPKGLALIGAVLTGALFWLVVATLRLFRDTPFWLSSLHVIVQLTLMAGLAFGFPVRRQFKHRGDIETYLRRAAEEIETGRAADDIELIGDAMDDYLEATAIAPKSWAAHYGMSLALYEMGLRSGGSEQRNLLKRAENFGNAALKINANDETRYLLDCISSSATESA